MSFSWFIGIFKSWFHFWWCLQRPGNMVGATSLEPCQSHVTQGGMVSVVDSHLQLKLWILESEGKKCLATEKPRCFELWKKF